MKIDDELCRLAQEIDPERDDREHVVDEAGRRWLVIRSADGQPHYVLPEKDAPPDPGRPPAT